MSGVNNKKNIIVLSAYTLIENMDDSNSSSESELDIEIFRELNRRIRVPRMRCKNYVENIVSAYLDMEFKTHFR